MSWVRSIFLTQDGLLVSEDLGTICRFEDVLQLNHFTVVGFKLIEFAKALFFNHEFV